MAGSELHTNFRLSASGEYLALIEPDGFSVSHEYAAAYPGQFTDTSYGLEMTSTLTDLVAPGGAGRYLVPPNGSLGTSWTSAGFNDAGWTAGPNGFGFDTSGTMAPLIDSDIEGAMRGVNASAYFRFPFNIFSIFSIR